jgi:ribonuclease J
LTLTHHEFPLPEKLAPETLRVVALGGIGEIGRNMTVLQVEKDILIVDIGVLFPEENQPGVDLILPDFEYLRDKLNKVKAIVLTHAHEDHIGGVPYFLREAPHVPIYGSKLTLAFLAEKLKEHRIKADLRQVKEGDVEKIGEFEVSFIAVNHSIPDALALSVKTKAGNLIHTGDFKMDQLPLDGRITDLNAFAKLGSQGVDLALVDSTNAEIPGFIAHEKDLAPVIESIVSRAPRRVIVASFASHVHRVQQIIDAAHLNNRKIIFVGRSMIKNMGIARDLGYLKIPANATIELDEIDQYADDEIVLITTGSQGEPMSALSRMAGLDHKIRISNGDTVILASSLIPGNENSVNKVINGLTKQGANVVHSGNAKVHVSGHAASGELLYFYNILKPRNVMPIHGEPRHLAANASLAVKTGVNKENVVITADGVVVDLKNRKAKIVGAIPCGFVFVDGSSVGGVAEDSLKDRKILGEEGFISVVVVVDSVENKVVAGPEIHARGFSENDEVFEEVIPLIKTNLEQAMNDNVYDINQLQKVVRRTTGKWVSDHHRRRPMIIPVVVEA